MSNQEYFRLLKSEVKPLTLDLAREFRDLKPSPTERDLNPARVKHLQSKHEKGLLVTFHWSRAHKDGEVLRMNGQHSANVLSELNGSFPQGLYAHIDDYEVNGDAGLAMLFRQFDDRKSGRSAADVSGAYQMLQPALHELPRSVAKLGIEGVAWHDRQVEGLPVKSGDDVYQNFERPALHGYLLWLGEVLTIKTPELKQTAIAAAMYASFSKDATAARKFWAEVARGGEEFDDTAPSTVLDAWLKDIKEGNLKVDPKPGEIYQGCIYAWNAAREDRVIKDIKCDTRKGLHQAS